MKPLPDYETPGAFERVWGGSQSAAEQICEAHAFQVNEAINRAYDEFPQTGSKRREIVSAALDRAWDALQPHVQLSVQEKSAILDAYLLAMECDAEGSREGVRENAADIMFIYQRSIERRAV